MARLKNNLYKRMNVDELKDPDVYQRQVLQNVKKKYCGYVLV